jgi:prepilin-type N-terminal cleavage/methylation domain-containing protein
MVEVSNTHNSSGFTIIELLVVIVVIAILAAVAITSYTGISNRATEASVSSDVESIGKQLEIFKALNGRYPAVPLNLTAGNAPELEEVLRKAALYSQTRSTMGTDGQYGRIKSFIFCASPDGTQITIAAYAPIVKNVLSTELDKAVGKPIYYYSSTKANGVLPFKNTTGIQDTGVNVCNTVVDGYNATTWPRRWSFDIPTKDADAQ